MSQAAGAPAGIAPGGGVGMTQNMQTATDAANSFNVPVPSDSQFGGLPAAMRGMQNMLGATPKEREENAKALAAAVKDIGGLVGTLGETTLMKRMMEAQGSGLGFMDPASGGQGIGELPRSFTPAVASPVMSQLGFK